MILLDINQDEVTLQVVAQNSDGSEKFDVDTGSVRVYHMSAGAEVIVLESTAMSQAGTVSIWRYNWEPSLLPAREYVAEYTLTDSEGVVSVVAEDLVVKDIATQASLDAVSSQIALVQTDLTTVRKVETGRWKIVSSEMIFYDDDGVTPILTFDLKDESGAPSATSVFERVPA